MRKFLYLLFIVHISYFASHSQTCPSITAGTNATICTPQCATLTATATPTFQTTSYTISTIPYNPQPYTGTQVLGGVDDEWSAVINLGFNFCYYGTMYSQCVIGSNGVISFDLSNAFGYNTWPIAAAVPSTTPTDLLNCIMSPWHDIDPSIGGAIYYQTLGTAPCRMFVVSFSQVPMFSCNNLIDNQQIVLYETTNIIDIFIGNKPLCTTWNGGYAIEAIQDPTGTQAAVVAGRNYPTQWTASNDGRRFTPSGTATSAISWYDSFNTLVGTGNAINVCPTTTTTYYAQVVYTQCDNSTVSMNSNNVTVTVSPGPTLTTSSTSSGCLACTGTASVVATGGTPPYTYSWNTTPAQSTSTATGLCGGTYVVTVSTANGCNSTASVTVPSSGGLTSLLSQSNVQCNGQCTGSATINPSGGTPPYTYSWTTTPVQTTQTASGLCAGNYTVVVTDANGCTTSQSVVISQPPAMSVTASGSPATVCSSQCATLSATPSGGNPPYTYSWVPGNMTGNNVQACPTATTTYTVIITDANNCTVNNTAMVTVNAPPSVTVTASPASYCAGGSSNLNASGGVSYSWSPATGLSNTTLSNPVATPTVTTTYTVIVTDANGCTNSGTVTVTVNAVPNVAASATPANICVGGSSSLTASGALSYVWTPSTGLSSSTGSNPTATPGTTITYTVTGTDANGCTNTATVTVVVSQPPNATASASPSTICVGASSNLSASGGVSYTWSPASGLSSTTGANPVATPSTSTTYTVIVTNAAGCTATATVNITITAGPLVAAGSATDETCGNNDGTATAGAVTGNGPFTYSWSPGGQSTATATGLAAGTYTVLITDAAGCTTTQSVTVGQVLGVNAAASANPGTGVWPLNVAFTNGSTGANNYFWNFGDMNTSTQQNPTHIYTSAGTYTVMLVAWNNNPSCADTAYLTIVVYDEVIFVLPNVFTPNADGQNDMFNATAQGLSDITGEIYDRWGLIVGYWTGGVNGGWDGKTRSGKMASDGTYYYVLTATGLDGKTYEAKGYVQLIKSK
ncbi:MAG: gliding motility-associated C-terminal domain-containing protein [Bacteroidota bacterium]